MEIRRYLSIVRRRWLLVTAIIVVALAAGVAVTPRGHTYTATSLLYVGSRSVDVAPASGDVSGDRVAGFDRLINTFAAMVTTRSTADAAIADAKVARSPDAVVAETTASQVPNTNLIQIAVTDSDASVSRALANSQAQSIIDQVRSFEPQTAGAPADQAVSVYQRAEGPTGANHSELRRNVALAGLFGVIVAILLLALLEHLDITVRSAEDAERELDVPVLAVVPSLGRRLPLSPTAGIDEQLPRPKESAGRTGQLQ
jgi:receptor protein-tyrosine kinase